MLSSTIDGSNAKIRIDKYDVMTKLYNPFGGDDEEHLHGFLGKAFIKSFEMQQLW